MKKSEAGFTTVELIVAIQIAFLLAGFVYAVFHFSTKLFSEWREKSEIETAAFLYARSLQRDISHASQILTAGECELILRSMNDQLIAYEIEAGRITRNHRSLFSSDAGADSLFFRYAKQDTAVGAGMLNANVIKYFNPKHELEIAQISLIEFEIILVKRKQRMSVKSSAMPRNTASNVFDLL